MPSVKTKDFVSGDEDVRFETIDRRDPNVGRLYNSPLGEVKIKKITSNWLSTRAGREFAVEDVWINKDTAKPGETLNAAE